MTTVSVLFRINPFKRDPTLLVESRKTRRKAIRQKLSGGKLVARTENNLRQI